MADTPTGWLPNSTPPEAPVAGTWQTVEQAAVALGLSVRTVNRHISAQKLKSRLMDGRREVLVASPHEAQCDIQDNHSDSPLPNPKIQEPETTADTGASANSDVSSQQPDSSSEQEANGPKVKPSSFLDLDTALALADRKSDRQTLTVYQSLTRSIETQAHSARRTAAIAWCVVGVLMVGVTITMVWTATRVTKAETDSQHLKEQADLDALRLKQQVDEADRRADNQEKELADMQQKLSEAQQQAARAEGRAAVYEEIQGHQPASRPTSRPTTLIDKLTNAFGTGQ